jgi:hypothetical protein
MIVDFSIYFHFTEEVEDDPDNDSRRSFGQGLMQINQCMRNRGMFKSGSISRSVTDDCGLIHLFPLY